MGSYLWKRRTCYLFGRQMSIQGLMPSTSGRLSATIRHHHTCGCQCLLVCLMLLLTGFIAGVLLNYNGLVLENIHLRMDLRMEDMGNTSAVAHRLLLHLPHGFRLSHHHAVQDQYVVPNIVHFIWFGENKTMSLINYVSILSAHKMQKPDVLMLHCDHLPVGEYWERLWRQVPIKIMHRQPPDTIHGQKLGRLFHKGDVAKLYILLKYGGIYLDYDVIVLRPLDPLRKFDATMGKEKLDKLIAGIIIAKQNAPFLQMWIESYRGSYRALDWDYNCARVAYELYKKRPDLLHVEKYKLTTPDALDRKYLFDEAIDWRGMGLYVVHLMGHDDKTDYTPESVKSMNSTFGEVMRYIYYGSSALIRGYVE